MGDFYFRESISGLCSYTGLDNGHMRIFLLGDFHGDKRGTCPGVSLDLSDILKDVRDSDDSTLEIYLEHPISKDAFGYSDDDYMIEDYIRDSYRIFRGSHNVTFCDIRLFDHDHYVIPGYSPDQETSYALGRYMIDHYAEYVRCYTEKGYSRNIERFFSKSGIQDLSTYSRSKEIYSDLLSSRSSRMIYPEEYHRLGYFLNKLSPCDKKHIMDALCDISDIRDDLISDIENGISPFSLIVKILTPLVDAYTAAKIIHNAEFHGKTKCIVYMGDTHIRRLRTFFTQVYGFNVIVESERVCKRCVTVERK